MAVTYSSGSATAGAFLAEPEGAGPFPGMIVIHEWWGINDQIKAVTKQFAEQGYVSLAVDLYQGKIAKDRDQAQSLSQSLSKENAVADMRAGMAFLKARPNVQGDKLGSIGWCMGGGYSLFLAMASPDLAACVIYYGNVTSEPEELGPIACPLLGIFGEDDPVVPVADVKAFEESIRKLNKDITVHIYSGAGHAFANPTNSAGYRADAAEDAWDKTMAFLGRQLK
jgi:carboxymethylenebutenolidase